MRTRGKSSEFQLLSGLFFRLLPYQVLLIVISAVNGIVDSLYASNEDQQDMTAFALIWYNNEATGAKRGRPSRRFPKGKAASVMV